MKVLALSSGTSVDAIDVALAELDDDAGTLALTPLGHTEVPWPAELRERILAALPPAEIGVGEWCRLDTLVGQTFAEAAAYGLERLGPADLIASHGQTLYHWVEEGRARGTLQVGAPAWIHERTGVPVVHDLRSADVAAGGHGAPLVSLLDHLWLGERRTAALNVGGIANITVVGPAGQTAGARVVTGDTGPGNCLIDAAVADLTGRPYDAGGELAAAGTVDGGALEVLLADPFYRRELPRSTGREHFHSRYVAERLGAAGLRLSGPDLVATLTELTARTVADQVRGAGVERVVVSGGGAHNPVLMARLRDLLPPVVTATELGLDGDAKEAYLFAVLGYLGVRALPGTAPRTTAEPDGPRATGARHPAVLGSLTPPAPAPCAPATAAVRRLVIVKEHP
ncbi:anhydro-N-acetylmuramic acid kinase [Georgenia subflava]|uniref:Anhydro-N-acetylmuramic acid kinase n=1 Tax=Georgenia subflava TaxID=1622177 RepID=A0A6N7ENN6_9MICO|nr:anhydro-N-acetylmuramic acid kinase [Georgenia subflava]MPV38713.1 anhydro-N-acetylmuramic acid kinase [Georgenia subflava]